MVGQDPRLYGLSASLAADGARFATRWLTLVNRPILPLARYRITILSDATGESLVHDVVDHYRILETTPIAWAEVARTWWRYNGTLFLHVVPWLVLGWGVRAQQARIAHGLPRSDVLTALNFVVMLVALYELIALTLWRLRR